jgi:hypothetical protein
MRQTLLLSIALLFFSAVAFCQTQTIIINPLQQKTEELYRNIYKYPKFVPGKIVYTDSAISEGSFNYHKVFNQILFIGSRGDTLTLAHPETSRYIVIGTDTFTFYRKTVLEKLTHHPEVNLFMSDIIKYIGKERKGAYGTYSTIYSVNSNSTVTNNDQITQYLELDENLIFKSNYEFFLSDRFNNLFPADKKGFYNFFSKNENELRSFLKKNSINFQKKEDLQRLLNHMNSL